MELIYGFNSKVSPELTQVGGKGMSLIRMTNQGLPVPPGFVMSVEFFKPWFDYIKSTPEWHSVINSSANELKLSSEAMKKLCMSLKLDEERRKALIEALNILERKVNNRLFAVRSSSPEEDLEGASFAGGYETTLGVRKDNIEDALRRSFASSLDERVFVYKKEHGFPIDNPRIAVIVQSQIQSETAGVAFSLNPLNNCYDEAVINANFGLGESVVSGLATPDTFIVDKNSKKILEKKAGKKETSIWLDLDGGTYEKTLSSAHGVCLEDNDLLSLVNMLIDVERYYKIFVDIEWAFSDGKLYLLQARPITAYIPLHEKMQTAPGQQKQLYLDATLAKQGIHEPLSVMGTDYLSMFQSRIEISMTGKDNSGVAEGIQGFFQGKMYLNVSNNIKLYGKKKLIDTYRLLDMASAEIIANISEDEYVPKELPEKLRGVISGTIRNSLGMGVNTIKALNNPSGYEKIFLEKAEEFVKKLKNERCKEQAIKGFAESVTEKYVSFFVVSLPILAVIAVAKSGLGKIFRDSSTEIKSKVTFIEKALPNNITTKMGLSMYRLSLFDEIKKSPSFEEFEEKWETKSLSADYINAWEDFMERYGFRCPKELDIATPRMYEEAEAFYKQLKTLAENTDPEHNPESIFNRARQERESDFELLLREAEKKRKSKKFKKYYDMLITFSGYREAPKYYWIMTVAELRRKVIEAAEALAALGRIDNLNQVFDLTIDDLDMAMADTTIDLRQRASQNTVFLKRLANIKEFPRVIDSRGKILHPPKKEARNGELAGEPISPGTVRGPVKVLKSPEKPVLPGEILVARATDPGWTPLFINAAGVILEVGGMLQHGALVAREYGKPCVSGVENAVSVLKDGQLVEIDGLNGIIRLL
ncbi:PEP/pyruvate-binding domain-containing protein [Sedimentibacter sp.]|uniref:PEP/pyruvate-binding domain-containing protein n=1 Tax=Sedimentibacter sp. TaxID=1960295 RepID=UPI0028AEF9E5|nr:PEP/pyruvate-binding domain-containing protein [Sedimentibacter sp.]